MVTRENSGNGYVQWGPSAPRAVLLLVHGLGAHALRWEALAGYFTDKQISSYAVKLRSINGPGSSGASIDRFRMFYDKISNLYDIASKENPSKKIFLVGESMGALISFLYIAAHPERFAGLICISPAFLNRYKPSPSATLKMVAPLLYNQKKEFKLPFDASMCSRDPQYRKKITDDPLGSTTASSRLIFEILTNQIRARVVKNKIKSPVLFLVAGDDKIVDPSVSKAVFKGLTVKDKTYVEFPGMYHSLSIDLDRAKVYEEMSKWIEKRITP